MSQTNPSNALDVRDCIEPASRTAGATNGAAIDCRGFEYAMFIVASGTNQATGTLDCKIQESSDNAVSDAYADVTGATFTQITTANDTAVRVCQVRLHGRERYLRMVGTVATAACIYGGYVVLSGHEVDADQTVSFDSVV
ncbi:MAG: hypothetical protein ACPGWS_06755 [Solirubrobacterales bacterium]